MDENEFILYDRLEVIKTTIEKYGEDNFYLSFSGGKDSTVVHHLLDMALPGNKIPRVFANTGIEYLYNVKFVKSLSADDDRFVIIPPTKNIKKTLDKVGYPFKSKMYSSHYSVYRNHKEAIWKEMDKIEKDPSLKWNYDYIHNLPRGVKTIIKYIHDLRERESTKEIYNYFDFTDKLLYQWHLDLNISDNCCLEFKEKPLQEWQRANKKEWTITGMMAAESGRRSRAQCFGHSRGKPTFNPLAKVSSEWERWFIDKYDIKLSQLYYPPFNFERTGCRGCPFNNKLQKDLDVMEEYMPNERNACELIFKPVYDEYRRIGYRLKDGGQTRLF